MAFCIDNHIHKGVQERQKINTDSLRNVFIYLSGLKDGRGGNILPLGTNDLDELLNAIKYLNGDNTFTSRREEQGRPIKQNEENTNP